MRIAIPISGGKLSLHFGHCEKFSLIDVDMGQKQVIRKDEVASPPHQPGLLPRWLQEHGTDIIVAGGMGMRAQQLFAEKNIRVVIGTAKDDPDEIVSDILEGQLETGKNPCDH